ncbi:phage virion morphogenesis protein [Iodobacter sp. LRB]|uniref:phage virion morphogenesis protein n=1 Tax=unclassified Iodobacter TaxID=235634 RepID=UPI000C0CF6BE|nr:phage virion morphogenesis protein [Iodobacter sp. BJB302]PHV01660.1 phage virion morphogenesis protein [Iodobacter sp. BJB302]
MSDNLKALEGWASGLLGNLDAKALRGMNKRLAAELRKRQQAHIAANQNPDGTPYAPRLPQMRKKGGRIKRKMFTKLRTARHLKTQSTANGAAVYFSPSANRLASVHQFGLLDTVNARHGIRHRYAARVLLGFSQSDDELITKMILNQLIS